MSFESQGSGPPGPPPPPSTPPPSTPPPSTPPPPGFPPVGSVPPAPPAYGTGWSGAPPPAQPGGSRTGWIIGALTLGILFVVLVGAIVLLAGGPGSSPTPTDAGRVSPTPTGAASPTSTPSPTAPASPTAMPTGGSTPTGSPAGPTPSASPSASPDPSATPTPPLAGQTLPPDISAQIDQVVSQVPPLRELAAQREVPYRLLTRDQLADELRAMFEEEVDVELLSAEERLLKRMALVPADADLYEMLLELYGGSIAAFYRPDTGAFYVVERDRPFGPLDKMIVAHEYTHALQDQHFDLEGTRISDPAEGDAALAQLAAVEGDASHLMYTWTTEHLSVTEQVQLYVEILEQQEQNQTTDMPPILTRQLEFPYAEGYFFIQQVHADGGWTAVDETLRTPPESTEQILHIDKYYADERPAVIELPDLTGALGSGWAHVYSQTFGELNVGVWVAAGEGPDTPTPGLPGELPHAEVAAGWGGDRLHMYEDGSGGWAIVWQTAWDSAGDAGEFQARADQLLATLGGPARLLADGENIVTMLVARDQATLDRLADGL